LRETTDRPLVRDLQRPSDMKIKEVMRTRSVLSVRANDDVALAAQLMGWGNVRHLPVLEHGKVVGVFSERDLLRYRAETGGQGGLDPVRRFMSAPAEVVSPDDEVAGAMGLMLAAKLGCLPVVENQHLVGLLTLTDLVGRSFAAAAAGARAGGGLTATGAMTFVPVTVTPGQPLLEAIGLMIDYGVRHLPVVDDGQVVGILSDRDVRAAVGDPGEALSEGREGVEGLEVGSVMSTDVILLQGDASLAEVAQKFLDSRVGAIPVVDGKGSLLGIISYLDLIRAQAAASQQ
jgi:CBS domain-containing membrane protein